MSPVAIKPEDMIEAVARVIAARHYDDVDAWWRRFTDEARAVVESITALSPPVQAEPAFWAVHSPAGLHIGLWPDEALARKVMDEAIGATIQPLYAAPPSVPEARKQVIEECLRKIEALQRFRTTGVDGDEYVHSVSPHGGWLVRDEALDALRDLSKQGGTGA